MGTLLLGIHESSSSWWVGRLSGCRTGDPLGAAGPQAVPLHGAARRMSPDSRAEALVRVMVQRRTSHSMRPVSHSARATMQHTGFSCGRAAARPADGLPVHRARPGGHRRAGLVVVGPTRARGPKTPADGFRAPHSRPGCRLARSPARPPCACPRPCAGRFRCRASRTCSASITGPPVVRSHPAPPLAQERASRGRRKRRSYRLMQRVLRASSNASWHSGSDMLSVRYCSYAARLGNEKRA